MKNSDFVTSFNQFCSRIDNPEKVRADHEVIAFTNTNELTSYVSAATIQRVVERWAQKRSEIEETMMSAPAYDTGKGVHQYQEKPIRAVFDTFFPEEEFSAARTGAGSQTRSFMAAINKFVGYTIGEKNCELKDGLLLTAGHLTQFLARKGNTPPLSPSDATVAVRALVSSFSGALQTAGYSFDESLLRRFVASLAAKPLLILTGNSGSGKSRIAQFFGEWLGGNDGVRMIPVGADWIDRRPLLGFVDLLNRDQAGDPTYESTEFLELLIQAQGNPARPYIAVLDEMNLSHVERYFADILSVMESGKPIVLHSQSKDLNGSMGTGVPSSVTFPPNLFVIGTVNIDETTYMFSPKVLDRAHVLEIGVTRQQMHEFLQRDQEPLRYITAADSKFAAAFLSLSYHVRNIADANVTRYKESGPLDGKEESEHALLHLFSLLSHQRFEFAFRTASEIRRYLRAHSELTETGWQWRDAIDAEVVAKILPRLHGTRRKLEPVLAAITFYALEGDLAKSETMLNDATAIAAVAYDPSASPMYPLSYAKAGKMLEMARSDQFASFIQ